MEEDRGGKEGDRGEGGRKILREEGREIEGEGGSREGGREGGR